jgi:hypothetical protein
MASATYLSNPEVVIGGVTLTDMCSAATLNHLVEALEDSVFGNLSRTYTGGMANNEVTLTFYASYAASETYASLSGLVGTKTTVTLQPTSDATSATNPLFQLDRLLSRVPTCSQCRARNIEHLRHHSHWRNLHSRNFITAGNGPTRKQAT